MGPIHGGKMKFIPLLILALFSISAQSIEVIELNSGSCWASADGLKIVSFGENKSFNIENQSLKSFRDKLENELTQYKVKLPETFDLYLHCNSFNSYLVFKFQGVGIGICVWASHDGENLKIDSIGNYEGLQKGICDGAIPGELLVFGEVPSLVGPLWKKYIEASPTLNKLILTKDYYFKEEMVIENLKEKFPNLHIERNYLIHRTGDSLKLRSTDFVK